MSGSAQLVSNEQFLKDFPAFQNAELYPPTAITMYLTLASNVLNPIRFGGYLQLASESFAAHYLTLDARDLLDTEAGNVVGQTGGQIASKSIAALSLNYDTAASIEEDGGHWNLTTFGKRFLRLARMAGTGGVQITGGCGPGWPIGVLYGDVSGQ